MTSNLSILAKSIISVVMVEKVRSQRTVLEPHSDKVSKVLRCSPRVCDPRNGQILGRMARKYESAGGEANKRNGFVGQKAANYSTPAINGNFSFTLPRESADLQGLYQACQGKPANE
jgi:hypothetical protein